MTKGSMGSLGIILTGAGIAGLSSNWWAGCLFAGITLMFVTFVWTMGDL